MIGVEAPLPRLARLIEEVSGNVIPEGHLRFLGDIAADRARDCGLRGVAEYVHALGDGALPGEWTHLLSHITINESYFFRTPQHFRALRTHVVPALLRARSPLHRLRVWSAGCARGEEPATLAIVFSEMDGLAGWDWRIVATDVDERALGEARLGEYGARAVEPVPEPLLDRYFSRRGATYSLAPTIQDRIEYHPLNLVREPYAVPQTRFDVILLRNVLIYFRPESQRRVISNMAQSLAPDGYLFLGPSETLWQISDEFEPEDLGDCFCYRPRSPEARPVRRAHVAPARRPAPSAGAVARPTTAAPRPGREPRRETATPVPSTPRPLPHDTRGHIAAITLHLAQGDLAGAEDDVRTALEANPTDATLRGLEGLTHDLAARLDEAVASYRAALFLDPALFQIRLLLADALRRLGWHPRARHEYREVLAVVSGGRARELDLPGVALPDRDTVLRRCRAALTGS